jgi:hypothetical protein
LSDDYSSRLINYVTRVHFGYGALGELEAELLRLDAKRPLVVTDAGLQAAGVVERVMNGIACTVYAGTPSNPTEAAAREAAAVYREHRCDSIVALGGGSPLDMAKIVGMMQTHEGPLSNYALAHGGLERIRPGLPPLIAIPTTAGTGSEVARAAVLIMDDRSKLTVASPHLVPAVALCDPQLSFSLPPRLTAATGFDAIAHCIETFSSPNVNPPAAAIGLDGLARLVANIEQAVQQPQDRAARWHMLMGSMQGALAFQKGLGAVHALSHPLGAFGYHHGTLNGLLLPYVLDFNRPVLGAKMARIGEAMGLARPEAPDEFISSLLDKLGLPRTLRALGFQRESVAAVAAAANVDTCSATNPRPASEADYAELLTQALA